MEILRDPAWQGIGALASIFGVFLYMFLERHKLLAATRANSDSKGRDLSLAKAYFVLGFCSVLGITFAAWVQTIQFFIGDFMPFFWMGRILLYLSFLPLLLGITMIFESMGLIFSWSDFIEDIGFIVLLLLPIVVTTFVANNYFPSVFTMVKQSICHLTHMSHNSVNRH